MKSRKQNRWLTLAVLGIALQAIVPAGYMPAPIADGLPFVLCPGGVPGAALFAAGADAHHAGHDGEHQQAGEEQEPAPEWQFCPFGAVLGGPAVVAQHDAQFPLAGEPPLPAATDGFVPSSVMSSWRARAPPTEQPIDV